MEKKFLIIRLSSFGDIVQCLSVVDSILKAYPDAKIDWVVRSDFKDILQLNANIKKIWSFDRKSGFGNLIEFSRELKGEHYDFVYDAHCNLRSFVIKTIIAPWWRKLFCRNPKVITRSKERLKRFLLFKFGINRFPWPYRGMSSYQAPLKKWGVLASKQYMDGSTVPRDALEKVSELVKSKFEKTDRIIVLVPSAAWKMKRWPLSHWRRLIKILGGYNFVVLGGSQDIFCSELELAAKEKVLNLAGKMTLVESCAVISISYLTISADTGLLHVADYLGKNGIALIGPTAFGFPAGNHIKTLDVPLKCRPCTKDGRGTCSQEVYQKCLVDLTSERVANCVRNLELEV